MVFLACTFEAQRSSECFLFLEKRVSLLVSGSVHGVFPMSLCLVPILGLAGGSGYGLSSGLYTCLNRLTSLRQLMLAMIEFGLNTTRCSPASVRTLDIATYVIPVLNLLSERSTLAQSNDKPWHCELSQHWPKSRENVYCTHSNFS